jgi:uncharacterized Fe-S cluster protein YjdI
MVASGVAEKVVFHCKTKPWFVSDTSPADLAWQVAELCQSDAAALAAVGALFQAGVVT